MRESLAECIRGVEACRQVCADAIELRDWRRAAASARGLLSWAGKLHQRVDMLMQMAEDAALEARAVAEVDRALASNVRPVKGEQPLPFPPERGASRGKGRKRGGAPS